MRPIRRDNNISMHREMIDAMGTLIGLLKAAIDAALLNKTVRGALLTGVDQFDELGHATLDELENNCVRIQPDEADIRQSTQSLSDLD